MCYCNQDQLAKLIDNRTLTQLSNDEPTATTPNWAVVNEAIVFAENTIDGYLRGRYTLPLLNFDKVLTNWATFIARHWLYSRRMGSKSLPSDVTLGYKDAIESLKLVQNGKLHLGVGGDGNGDAGGSSGGLQPEAGQIRIRSGVRQFDAERLNQF